MKTILSAKALTLKRRHGSAACILPLAILLVGCKTPDIHPFADATAAVGMSVAQGGDMVVTPLTKRTINNKSPGAPDHPGVKLATAWDVRRATMEAVVQYSASLVAISDAAAKSQNNASQVVGAVQELARNIPNSGIQAGLDKAGDLLVYVGKTIIEIKAYHDMAKAVQAADPAIQEIAKVLQADFKDLAVEYYNRVNDDLDGLVTDLRPVERHYQKLKQERDRLRDKVNESVTNTEQGNELARISELLSKVEPEYETIRRAIQETELRRARGQRFFQETQAALSAWAQAHASLARTFREKTKPNFILLITKAEELRTLINQLRDN